MSNGNFGKIFYNGKEVEFIPDDVTLNEDWGKPYLEIRAEILQINNIQKEINPMDTKDKKKLFVMDNDERYLYEAGYIDIDGELTAEGRAEFIQYLFDSNEESRAGWTKFLRALDGEDTGEDDGE